MRASSLLLLSLMACEAPLETTGPGGMVGKVLGPDGAPVAGLTVESVETPRKTDAEGRFSVRYQPPNQHVHFRIGQVWFQRSYQPEDAGHLVEIPLPPARMVDLECGSYQGDLSLRWDLEPGYFAEVRPRCAPGEVVALQHVPRTSPAPRVRQGEPPALVDRGERLVLEPPLKPLRVELRAEGALPEGCEVWVGERQAEPAGEGFFVGQLGAPSTVAAFCAGRPALPVQATRDQEQVSLEWSPIGPVLDLVEHAPWARQVRLSRLDSPPWTLRLGADEEGRFLLPALAPGDYAVAVTGAQAEAPEPPARDEAPGLLWLAPVPDAEALVGRLELRSELVDGQVRLRMVPELEPGR